MKKAQKDKLEKALSTYFKEIHKIHVAGDFREESFYNFCSQNDDLLHMGNITEGFQVK